MTQYATITDLFLYGFREEARGDLTDQVLNAALASASTTVDGFLGQRFGFPLSTWTDEIRQWCCWLATFDLMTGPRGLSSASPDYDVLRNRSDAAKDYLKRAQRQDYHPVGLVPVTAPPGTSGTQPLVISFSAIDGNGTVGTRRGW